MSVGLRALMNVAEQKQTALSFPITLHAGQTIVTGRVAPAWWWYDLSEKMWSYELDQMVDHQQAKHRDDARQQGSEQLAAMVDELRMARRVESDVQDEITLFEASAIPAVASGTPGGFRSRVLRIPLVAVQSWWIIDTENIPGKPQRSTWVGFSY